MFFSQSFERATAVLEDPKHIAIAKKLSDNVLDVMMDCVDMDTADKYSVLCHGDCWINNMLFRYTDDTVSATMLEIDK